MNFGFDDTQLALRDLARDLFAKESPPSRLRELWDGKPFDRAVWRKMAEVGICGLTVPEIYGGGAGNEIDLTLLYEEAGRAALPEPLLETVGVAAPIIAERGTPQQRDRWLPTIATGEVMAAVRTAGQELVPWGAEADLLIWWTDDSELHAIDKANFDATPVNTIDAARPMARVSPRLDSSTVLESAPTTRGVFGTAAILSGLAMGLLEMTVAYVKEREQFGRPVGSFQAVKHKLASMHVEIETARPATWYAGYAIAHGADDADEAAAVALHVSAAAEALCNREALQCHGGIGFTWEHDLHFWLKRGMLLRAGFGGTEAATRALANTVRELAR